MLHRDHFKEVYVHFTLGVFYVIQSLILEKLKYLRS